MPLSMLTPFLLIFPGIAFGVFFRYLLIRMHREELVPVFRRRLQKAILLFLNPAGFVLALWVLDTSDPGVFLRLPLIGLFALLSGYFWGGIGSRAMRLEPLQAGVWRSSASFTNIGNIGGIIVFAILGEAGYAFIPFYKLCEELWYYGVVFPAASRDGERVSGVSAPRHPFSFVRDPFFLVSLAAIAGGMALNLSGIERPVVLARVNPILVPAATFGLLTSIGLSLHFGKISIHLRKAFALCGIKFLLTPLATCGVAVLAGITPAASPVLFQTVMILSAMPTGFLSLVPPSLYGLDLDLANACWFVTTAALIFVLPVLWLLAAFIPG